MNPIRFEHSPEHEDNDKSSEASLLLSVTMHKTWFFITLQI